MSSQPSDLESSASSSSSSSDEERLGETQPIPSPAVKSAEDKIPAKDSEEGESKASTSADSDKGVHTLPIADPDSDTFIGCTSMDIDPDESEKLAAKKARVVSDCVPGVPAYDGYTLPAPWSKRRGAFNCEVVRSFCTSDECIEKNTVLQFPWDTNEVKCATCGTEWAVRDIGRFPMFRDEKGKTHQFAMPLPEKKEDDVLLVKHAEKEFSRQLARYKRHFTAASEKAKNGKAITRAMHPAQRIFIQWVQNRLTYKPSARMFKWILRRVNEIYPAGRFMNHTTDSINTHMTNKRRSQGSDHPSARGSRVDKKKAAADGSAHSDDNAPPKKKGKSKPKRRPRGMSKGVAPARSSESSARFNDQVFRSRSHESQLTTVASLNRAASQQ